MASTGPMPMILGSQPTRPQATIRARGLRPCALTASSLATTTAPAPSAMPEALAAVTSLCFRRNGLEGSGVRMGFGFGLAVQDGWV